MMNTKQPNKPSFMDYLRKCRGYKDAHFVYENKNTQDKFVEINAIKNRIITIVIELIVLIAALILLNAFSYSNTVHNIIIYTCIFLIFAITPARFFFVKFTRIEDENETKNSKLCKIEIIMLFAEIIMLGFLIGVSQFIISNRVLEFLN